MSLSLVTKGRLGGIGGGGEVIREQFTGFNLKVVTADAITVSASALREVTTTIRVSPLKVSVSVIDTVTGDLAEESRIKVKVD